VTSGINRLRQPVYDINLWMVPLSGLFPPVYSRPKCHLCHWSHFRKSLEK